MQTGKTILLYAVAISLLVLTGFVSRDVTLSWFMRSESVAEQERQFIRKILPQLAMQLNEKAPYMIDPSLRFDEVVSDSDALNITYFNTFISLTSEDTDFAFVDEHLPGAVEYLCNAAEIRKLMSYGVNYTYVYRSRDGVPVREYVFTENHCNLL